MSLLNELYAIADISYRTTKAEIVEFYQEQGMPMAQLARDLVPFSVNPKTGQSYQARSLERDFNPDRIDKPTRTAAKKLAYEEFGKTLPPIVKFPEFNVKFKGKILISRKWKHAEFTVRVTKQGIHWHNLTESHTTPPEEALQFLQDGWEGWLFLAYFKGDELAEDWEGTFTIE